MFNYSCYSTIGRHGGNVCEAVITVEGTAFKWLVVEFGYKVPSTVHSALYLHKRYFQVKAVVMEHLQ